MATNPPRPEAIFNRNRGISAMNSVVNLPLPSEPVGIITTSDTKEEDSETDTYVYEHMYDYVQDS